MKNTLLALVLLATTAAWAAGHKRPAAPEPLPSPSLVAPSPVPVSCARIQVGEVDALPGELAMIQQGAALAEAMLDKPCFTQWVSSAKYTETNGLTQAQVLVKVKRDVSKVDIEMYTGDWWANHKDRTVGYENDPFDGVVHMNRYFVNSAYMVGDNLIHEDRGHSLGFHHYGTYSTSVPYGMNYAYEGCFQQRMSVAGYRPPGLRIRHVKHGENPHRADRKRHHLGQKKAS